MAMLEEATEAPGIRVSPSAALELMWLLHCCATTHPLKGSVSSLESLRLKFQSELQALQADGVCGATEIVVLAQRSGSLLDRDLDRFFAGFDAAAMAGGDVPSLLSETASERRAVQERLRRLQADPKLRARYRSILESVWKVARDEWQIEGREAAVEAAAVVEEVEGGGGCFGGVAGGVGEPGFVVDADEQVVPAGFAFAAVGTARLGVAGPLDAAEPLGIDVDQLAGPQPLVADHRLTGSWLEAGDAVAAQDRVHR